MEDKINGKWMPNGHYFIGIASDKFDIFDNSIWNITSPYKVNKLVNVYGLSGNLSVKTNIIWNGIRDESILSKKNIASHFEIGKSNFKNDEVICIEYDGLERKLSFRKDQSKQFICSIKLKSKQDNDNDIKYWYPAISMANTSANNHDSVQIM